MPSVKPTGGESRCRDSDPQDVLDCCESVSDRVRFSRQCSLFCLLKSKIRVAYSSASTASPVTTSLYSTYPLCVRRTLHRVKTFCWRDSSFHRDSFTDQSRLHLDRIFVRSCSVHTLDADRGRR